ncbi:MAG: B12-binding domain-containing radical SAM protein, partial [Suilimivivens sp.]
MKFLLVGINSKYIHSNPAIHYLKEYAGKEYENSIELAEYTINHLKEDILADIYKRNPDVIGISCYIWNFSMVQELLFELPKILPGRDIWLGGPEVSFEGEKVLKDFPMITGIIVGEGEATFKELITCYRGNMTSFENISGLLLREGYTGAREELDLDELPFLYEDLTEYKNRIIYYETSRGCPFQCIYCLSSVDRKVRLRSMDKVKKELQFFLDSKVPQVKFVDRTFNCNREHAMEIWNYIREHDNGVTNFHFEVAADIMTQEQIAVLSGMRPGLVQLEIGIQTTNEKTLHEINRYVNTAHIAQVVALIRQKENIHIHLDLIAGLPFEDYVSFGHSFDEVYDMEPEQLQLGFLKVLKGSPMFYLAEKYGVVCQSKPPYEVLYSNWLSYGDVLRLKQIEEMVELYYNSNQFRATLRVLRESFTSPFAMFEALAEYYEEKKYFINTPARSYRYQVLLDFACKVDRQREELYKELLTYVYYLRENAKTRPSFAKDLSEYHETIWEFYRKEEEEPDILQGYRDYHAKQTLKMTHMEVFDYPVWEKEAEKICKKSEKPQLMLFDYQVRNPLNQDAKTVL